MPATKAPPRVSAMLGGFLRRQAKAESITDPLAIAFCTGMLTDLAHGRPASEFHITPGLLQEVVSLIPCPALDISRVMLQIDRSCRPTLLKLTPTPASLRMEMQPGWGRVRIVAANPPSLITRAPHLPPAYAERWKEFFQVATKPTFRWLMVKGKLHFLSCRLDQKAADDFHMHIFLRPTSRLDNILTHSLG